MDKVTKALQKLSAKELEFVKQAVLQVKANVLIGLDFKKLQSNDDIFRIRKGKLRIIFQKQEDGKIRLLDVTRRSDNTYNNC